MTSTETGANTEKAGTLEFAERFGKAEKTGPAGNAGKAGIFGPSDHTGRAGKIETAENAGKAGISGPSDHTGRSGKNGTAEKTGKVWLVGAGPGDRGLFTLKGLEVLQNADVVVYDALVGDEVLTMIPDRAQKINVGKRAARHLMEQDQINRVLLEQAQAGRKVVRLKGGDPFVFGRGGEELELLAQEGIPFEVVPGVTSALSVPAYNGIPVTHRDFASSVHIITGHRRSGGTADAGIDYEALVRTGGTLVFLMGVTSLPAIMKGLMAAGMDPDMPAAILEKGTTARQRRVCATAATLPEAAAGAGIQAPAIIVVGQVCRLADTFAWAEKRPLAGKKILVTRPREMASETSARLRRLGAEVLEIPAIETVPLAAAPGQEDPAGRLREAFDAGRIPECFGEADSRHGKKGEKETVSPKAADLIKARPDWLVFTSPTGVRVFMKAFLEEYDVRALWGIRIAAIGAGSAKELQKYGLRPDFVPSVYDGETLGRELAAMIRGERDQGAAQLSPVRIMIPRAAVGNPELVEELYRAGNVEILDIPTYETRYAPSGIVDERQRVADGEIDYAVFTSASTVRGFAAAMEGLDITGVKAVCIGKQTRAAADRYGMQTRMARAATIDALVDTVTACAREGW